MINEATFIEPKIEFALVYLRLILIKNYFSHVICHRVETM